MMTDYTEDAKRLETSIDDLYLAIRDNISSKNDLTDEELEETRQKLLRDYQKLYSDIQKMLDVLDKEQAELKRLLYVSIVPDRDDVNQLLYIRHLLENAASTAEIIDIWDGAIDQEDRLVLRVFKDFQHTIFKRGNASQYREQINQCQQATQDFFTDTQNAKILKHVQANASVRKTLKQRQKALSEDFVSRLN